MSKSPDQTSIVQDGDGVGEDWQEAKRGVRYYEKNETCFLEYDR